MIWDGSEKAYINYTFNNYTFNRSGDVTTEGTIKGGNNDSNVTSYNGKKGGYVCLYNAEEYLDIFTEVFAGNLGPRLLSMDVYPKYHSDIDHWTGSLYPDGSERRIGNVMLKFKIARGLKNRMVDTAVSKNCNVLNEYYVIFGQDAENRTAGSYENSNVWLGMGRGDFFTLNQSTDETGYYRNAWWFKYLFVTIMYKEDGAGGITVEDDINTENVEVYNEDLSLDYYQRYPLPKSCEE